MKKSNVLQLLLQSVHTATPGSLLFSYSQVFSVFFFWRREQFSQESEKATRSEKERRQPKKKHGSVSDFLRRDLSPPPDTEREREKNHQGSPDPIKQGNSLQCNTHTQDEKVTPRRPSIIFSLFHAAKWFHGSHIIIIIFVIMMQWFPTATKIGGKREKIKTTRAATMTSLGSVAAAGAQWILQWSRIRGRDQNRDWRESGCKDKKRSRRASNEWMNQLFDPSHRHLSRFINTIQHCAPSPPPPPPPPPPSDPLFFYYSSWRIKCKIDRPSFSALLILSLSLSLPSSLSLLFWLDDWLDIFSSLS